MENNQLDKYKIISKYIITILVFIVLNTIFLIENDPQWIISIIISIVVFIIDPLSFKICKFIINKGDKINNKLLNVLYYLLALPIIFIICLYIIALILALIVYLIELIVSLNLGWAILIAFFGIGIFTCILIPYFQTIIILILRFFNGSK